MGDGKRLKEIIESKGTNVRRVGMSAGISPTTLYSIIKNDSNIRLDYAIKLSDALDVPVWELSGACDKEKISEMNLPDENLWMERHLINVTGKILSKFSMEDMSKADILLRTFYMLNDSSREDVLGIITVLLGNNNNKDYNRG